MIAIFFGACTFALVFGVLGSLVAGYGFDIEAIFIISFPIFVFIFSIGFLLNLYLFFSYDWNDSKFWLKIRRILGEIFNTIKKLFLYSIVFSFALVLFIGAGFLISEIIVDWVLPTSCLVAGGLIAIFSFLHIKRKIT